VIIFVNEAKVSDMTKKDFFGVEVKHFRSNEFIRLRNKLFPVNQPLVMAILNATPDSFYSESRRHDNSELTDYLETCQAQGVSFIDLGAQSTRPGSTPISSEEQIERLRPLVARIRSEFPSFFISIDTSCPKVAAWALDQGADLINDVEGGKNNPEIWDVCARYNAPYILMHSRGELTEMHAEQVYQNITVEVLQELSTQLNSIKKAGVKDIIIDPGFGFSKSLIENRKLLNNLPLFQLFGIPILVGFSRKSMIYKTLNTSPENALNGTSILNTFAVLNGATFLRVHDPKEATEVIKLLKQE
jgi:dihydropteroate synthase